MGMNPKSLEPSGLNNTFAGENLSFADYIQHTRKIISSARVDLNSDPSESIIKANSPFELMPTHLNSSVNTGVLMIHGLYDSPYSQQDLGHYFANKGFLVRS